LREFIALQERWIESEKRLDRRTARIVQHIVNMAGKMTNKTWAEDEFMPGGREPRKQTHQEAFAILESLGARRVNGR